MKIVARTQNPLSSQGESTQMLRGEIRHSDLTQWQWPECRFERCSCIVGNVNVLYLTFVCSLSLWSCVVDWLSQNCASDSSWRIRRLAGEGRM